MPRPAHDLATTEEIIEEAKNGHMFILVDDEDRENEGDLVIPAQMATPEAINFMAKLGRGLICLALTKDRADRLGLEPQSRRNDSQFETAFTVSIEARDGVTTGISAPDRARTISVAIDYNKGPDDIVSPGHIFPLVARQGGVLVRAGHTEAAVDVARLAGLNPSGVICEIIRDDGAMARLDDLMQFAKLHGLKVGTIRDLIAYRRRHDNIIERVAQLDFTSKWGGDWHGITYRSKVDGSEQIALLKGKLDPAKPTLVRMHALSAFVDTFGELSPRSGLLEESMKMIAEAGSGVIVVITKAVPDLLSKVMGVKARKVPYGDPEMAALRDYGIGAQILADLQVQEMILLTNSHHTLIALAGYGLTVIEERAIPFSGNGASLP